VIQSLGRRYVQYINATYQRSGTLWEGRYKASVVESETYLLLCSRYIELNPTRCAPRW
jgi:putative transposase